MKDGSAVAAAAELECEELLARAESLVRRSEAARALGLLLPRRDEFRRRAPREVHIRGSKLIGVCLQLDGDMAGAYAQYRSILDLEPGTAPPSLTADVHNNLGMLLAHLGRHDEALLHYQASMRLDPAPPGDPGRAMTHNNIGLLLSDMGLPLEALRQFRASLAIKTASGDRRGEANTLDNIGALLLEAQRLRPAALCFRRALELRRDVGDLRAQASSHFHLGLLARRGGDEHGAMDHFVRALRTHGGGDAYEYLALQAAAAAAAVGVAGIDRAARLLHGVIRRADTSGALTIAIESLAVLERAQAEAGNYRAALQAADHGRRREERQERLSHNGAARKRHFNAAIAEQRAAAMHSRQHLRALQRRERRLAAHKKRLGCALEQRETLLRLFRLDLKQPIEKLGNLIEELRGLNPGAGAQGLQVVEDICRRIQERIHSLLSERSAAETQAETREVGLDLLLDEVAERAAEHYGVHLELIGRRRQFAELALYGGNSRELRQLFDELLAAAAQGEEQNLRVAVADGFLYVMGGPELPRMSAGNTSVEMAQSAVQALVERLGGRVVHSRRAGGGGTALAVPLRIAASGMAGKTRAED